jgi:hypothetical protein
LFDRGAFTYAGKKGGGVRRRRERERETEGGEREKPIEKQKMEKNKVTAGGAATDVPFVRTTPPPFSLSLSLSL